MSNTCPNCGNENKEGDKFCGECGSALGASTDVNKSEERGFLVCSSCGGFYKLQEGESPFDFESCECGGKLKFTKNLDTGKETPDTQKAADSAKDLKGKARGWFNQRNLKWKAGIGLGGVFCIAVIFIAATGMFSAAGNDYNKNDYVNFKVPEGLNVTDNSKKGYVGIEIYNGTKLVGSITTDMMTSNAFNLAEPEGKKITIAGKEAVEFKNGNGFETFIHISEEGVGIGTPGSTTYLGLKLKFKDPTAYNTIKNSLVIKKNPFESGS